MLSINQGDVYNQLTVIKEVDYKKGSPRMALCQCSCGNTKKVRFTSLRSGRTKSCGCLIKKVRKQTVGKLHPRWKGGRHTTAKGYIILKKPDHPNSRSDGKIFEHIFIMSEHLERPLEPEENVHHINGVKNDNRLENLELWSTSQPKGQRVKDKIQWALELLELYKDYDS